MKVSIYVRVSTGKQSVDAQLADLTAAVTRAGWSIFNIYSDQGYSGSKSERDRPGLKSAIEAGFRREYDVLGVWSIDRLARSTTDLLRIMLDLKSCGIELYSHRQAIDTTTPSGRMMWQLLGVFAEFEREMIRERVISGIENAKARGVKLGRPKLNSRQEEKVKALRAAGMGMLKIGRTLGIGTSQVQRICQNIPQ